MHDHNSYQLNPELDLMFERIVDVPAESIWAAWTTPELLKSWFCPLPWKTIDCEIDLRPGGIFRTVMQSPEGQTFPGLGCYLEIVANRKLVWTSALGPNFRPAHQATETPKLECAEFVFTTIILLEPVANGTKYSATVMHAHKEARIQHENMGFQEGWGIALNQLVDIIKSSTSD